MIWSCDLKLKVVRCLSSSSAIARLDWAGVYLPEEAVGGREGGGGREVREGGERGEGERSAREKEREKSKMQLSTEVIFLSVYTKSRQAVDCVHLKGRSSGNLW